MDYDLFYYIRLLYTGCALDYALSFYRRTINFVYYYYYYWPNINKHIEKVCKDCSLCQEYQKHNKPEPIIPYEIPTKPWQYIATDLFEVCGKHFLLTSDKYTKFPLVDEMITPITSENVANQIKKHCSVFGKPHTIYSDNGPHYVGNAFKTFVKDWGICHISSSPTYSQSNGYIERQVGYIKPLIAKSISNNQDISITLLNIRATPIDHKLKSPAELLLDRPIVTLLYQAITVYRS